MLQQMQAPLKRALVLSGGGARGAYEVGVLRYIFEQLPPALLAKGRLGMLCGTSVGAIHACFLAGSAQLEQRNISRLSSVWSQLKLAELVRMSTWELMQMPKDLLSMAFNPHKEANLLLNIKSLNRVVTQDIAWPQIGKNIASGHVEGLTVSTTHIASGKTVVFIDHKDGAPPSWTRDARRLARAVRIGPLHALASACIPLLFPAQCIDGAFYCDGGLRQNTPLSPALRLGADRVLVIAVAHATNNKPPAGASPLSASEAREHSRTDAPAELHPAQPEASPNAAMVLGKVFNALLLDHLDYDLQQLRGFNQLIEDGEAAFGPSFTGTLGRTTERMRGARYRKVEPLVIRPSRDLGELARTWLLEHAVKLPGPLGRVMRYAAESDSTSHSDFISYLAFDGPYANALMALGMHDADAARDQLIAFFSD